MYVKIVRRLENGNIKTNVIECDYYSFEQNAKKPDQSDLVMTKNCQQWNERVVEWIVHNNCDIYIQNNEGRTMECIHRHLN